MEGQTHREPVHQKPTCRKSMSVDDLSTHVHLPPVLLTHTRFCSIQQWCCVATRALARNTEPDAGVLKNEDGERWHCLLYTAVNKTGRRHSARKKHFITKAVKKREKGTVKMIDTRRKHLSALLQHWQRRRRSATENRLGFEAAPLKNVNGQHHIRRS